MPTSSPLSLSPPNAANVKPVLDEATRLFVRRALSAGLAEMDDLKKVVVSLMEESDQFSPERLAEGLVGGGNSDQVAGQETFARAKQRFLLG